MGHDPFGKTVSTFPDHALGNARAAGSRLPLVACRCARELFVCSSEYPLSRHTFSSHGTIDNVTLLKRFVRDGVDFLLSRRIVPRLRLIGAVERDNNDAFRWHAIQCGDFVGSRNILPATGLH